MQWLVVLTSLLVIGLAVPMLLKRVPPNDFYGFRTEKTMSSAALWYEANHMAAVNLIAAGLASIAICIFTGVLVRNWLWRFSIDFWAMIALILGSVVVSLLQLRRI